MAYDDPPRAPEMPRREFYAAVARTMADAGYQRKSRDQFLAVVSTDVSVMLDLNGSEFGMSLYRGAVCVPANKLALKTLKQIGTRWPLHRPALYPGIPQSRHTFSSGYVLNEQGHQRWWRFPPAGEMRLEDFLADLRSIATGLIEASATLQAVLHNPDIKPKPFLEEPAVRAYLGDVAEFDRCVARSRAIMAANKEESARRSAEVEKSGRPYVTIVSSYDIDFDSYYAALRNGILRK